MELVSSNLRPIEPSVAARAIGRFLEKFSSGEDYLDSVRLENDIALQLATMQATLEKDATKLVKDTQRGRAKRGDGRSSSSKVYPSSLDGDPSGSSSKRTKMR